MNVIDSYLDTLFAPYPNSSDMQRARMDLRDMMEDKFNDLRAQGLSEPQAVGQVIAEFGSLDEVAPVLGIDTELREAPGGHRHSALPTLQPERARRYAEAVRGSTMIRAGALALFVLSPVPLLGLIAVFGESGSSDGRDVPGQAVAAGVVAILVIVTIGILLKVRRSAQLEEFEDIESGNFGRTARSDAVAHELWDTNRSQATRGRMISIGLWVLAAVPVLLLASVGGENSSLAVIGVILTLCMVALGLVVAFSTNWSESAAAALLRENSDPEEEPVNPVIALITAVYWPVVVAVFLAWSFIGNNWGISWVIWPIAGVLYGGVWALNSAMAANRESERTQR